MTAMLKLPMCHTSLVFITKPVIFNDSSFTTARCNARVASAVLAIAILSVRHTPVLCQNDWTQDDAVFTER